MFRPTYFTVEKEKEKRNIVFKAHLAAEFCSRLAPTEKSQFWSASTGHSDSISCHISDIIYTSHRTNDTCSWPDYACLWADDTCSWSDYACLWADDACLWADDACLWTDLCMHAYEQTIHAHDQTMHAYEQTMHAYEQTIHAHDQIMHAYEQTMHVYEQTMHAYEQTMHAYEQTIHVYEQTMHACLWAGKLQNETDYDWLCHVTLGRRCAKTLDVPTTPHVSNDAMIIMELGVWDLVLSVSGPGQFGAVRSRSWTVGPSDRAENDVSVLREHEVECKPIYSIAAARAVDRDSIIPWTICKPKRL